MARHNVDTPNFRGRFGAFLLRWLTVLDVSLSVYNIAYSTYHSIGAILCYIAEYLITIANKHPLFVAIRTKHINSAYIN